jgi:CRP-like cAMP-binding protein
MDTSVSMETLRSHPFLEGMSDAELSTLAALAVQVRFAKDQMIFREGDESSYFYLLLDGKVALEVPSPGRTIRIATLGRDDELGWSSVLTPARKHFQARALEAVRAVAFDGPRLLACCEQDCRLGYDIMRRVLGVVAERLTATRMQLLDIFSPTGVKA